MKSRSYRIKIVLISLLLTLLAQGIFLMSWYMNMSKVNNEIDSSVDKKQFDYIYRNAEILLNDVDTLTSIIEDPNILKYTGHYWESNETIEADEKKDEVNESINNLHISPILVKKVYLIGNNKNQKNFAKVIGESAPSNEELPCFYDITRAGIDSVLVNGDGYPILVEKGDLWKLYSKVQKYMDQDNDKKIKNFINELEGNVVLCKYNNGSLIVLIINPDFLSKYFMSGKTKNRFLTMLDAEGRIIWTNQSNNIEQIKKAKKLLYSNSSGEWKYSFNNNKYTNDFMTLKPQEFKLIYTVGNNYSSSEKGSTILIYILISISVCIITVFTCIILSMLIVKPFSNLTKDLKIQSENVLNKINADRYKNGYFSNVSFIRKLFYVFLVSTIIPTLISGMLYSYGLYLSSKNKLQDVVFSISHQMAVNASNLINSWYIANQFLSTDEFESYLTKSAPITIDDRKNIETILLEQSIKISDFSYIVLLDANGKARYQSIYSQNPMRFDISKDIINKYEANKSNIFFVDDIKDMFNENAVAEVKKINLPKENNEKESKTVGYLQMFFKQDVFQSIKLDYQSDFSILRNDKTLIYQSSPDEKNIKEVLTYKNNKPNKSNTFIAKINGVDNIVAYEDIPNSNLKIYVYQTLDGIMLKSNELMLKNIIVVIVILALTILCSWIISQKLVKPIEIIKKDMEEVCEGNFKGPIEYIRYDEIGELVAAYNNMVDRINKLMEENTNSKLREQKLVTLRAQAELNMLQQQINPHFLYNTLEMIGLQSRKEGDDNASKMAITLAKLFRYSTKATEKVVKIKDEVEHVRNYIAIQEIRFHNKFTTVWNIDPSTVDHYVVKFILQPIVENCINHGIYEYSSGGIISISVKLENNILKIIISDNGIGMKSSELENLINMLKNQEKATDKQGGIALRNVYRRLKLQYEGRADMLIESKFMRGTKVTITIPVEFEE